MRWLVALLVLTITVLTPIIRSEPAEAAGCQYVLGFKALHDLIPDVVGDCKADQHSNPQNGDALQETTKGLLVWRKADNWTAFTDGYRTWINGPDGLQQRLNSDRFPWEPAAPCPLPSDAVTVQHATGAADGTVTVSGTAMNHCDHPIDLVVDVIAVQADGVPLVDAPSVYLKSIPAGASRAFVAHVPMAQGLDPHQYSVRFAGFDDTATTATCVEVGAPNCLKVDAWLLTAIGELHNLPDGQRLLSVAAADDIRIQYGVLGVGEVAAYSPFMRSITLSDRLQGYSAWVRAAVLSHELQHAVDDVSGRLGSSTEACYVAEEAAARREAQVWTALWRNHLPPNVDPMHVQENRLATMIATDPAGFVKALRDAYREQCAG